MIDKNRMPPAAKCTTAAIALVIVATCIFGQASTTSGNPSLGDCTCHSSGGYSISSNTTSPLQVIASGTFSVLVHANGTGGIVQFHPDARNNRLFTVAPNDTIVDNSLHDLDPLVDNLTIAFTFTAPPDPGQYKINIFIRSPAGEKPDIACIEFVVVVGSGLTFLNVIEHIFDHYNIYLGSAALVLLAIGTTIHEKNNRAVKVHGILCTVSLGLTAVNTALIFPTFLVVLGSLDVSGLIGFMHLVHIIVGFVGLGTGILAMLSGLAGFRVKWPGYVTMGCWGFCFVFGIVFWGVGV